MPSFGPHIRQRREALRARDPRYSLRQLAARIGVEPSYLSKVERQLEAPPSETKIRALAVELGDDPDTLLAMAGKVSEDVQRIIRRRPRILPPLIRELGDAPSKTLSRLRREVRHATRKESP